MRAAAPFACVFVAATLGCGSGATAGTSSSSSTAGAGGANADANACIASAQPDVPDINGKWAYYQVTSRVVTAAGFAEPFHTAVMSVLLVDQTQQGDVVTFKAAYCDHYSDDPEAPVHVVVPQAFVASLTPFSRTGSYVKEGGAWHYHLPQFWTVEGVVLANVATDPLPTTPTDPRVIDQDKDGKPGMTLDLTGLVDGDIEIVEREWTVVDGAPQSPDEIRGPLAFQEEQVIVASDPTSLKDVPQTSTSDPTQCASSFRLKRVPDTADCAFVKANFATLFP